jgi:hypothetical protein
VGAYAVADGGVIAAEEAGDFEVAEVLAAQLPSQSAPDLASYEIRLMAGVSS